MADPVMGVDEATKVLQAIEGLGVKGFIFLVTSIVGYAVYKSTSAYIAYKRSKDEEAKKASRGSKLTASLDKLSDTLESHARMEDRRSREQSALLKKIVLLQTGYISVEDSIQVIKDAYLGAFLRDVQRIAETSIYRNHWAEDRDNIEVRVTSALQKLVETQIQSVEASYHLSLNVNECFRREEDGIRFKLVTACWDVIKSEHERRYAQERHAGQRRPGTAVYADNVHIQVENAIRTEWQTVEHELGNAAEKGYTRFIRSDFLFRRLPDSNP